MTHDEMAKVLTLIRPGAQWKLIGDELEWLDEEAEQPTDSEMTAGLAQVNAVKYRELRAPEYPPLTELADAIFHQNQGDDAPMEAYIAKCEAVKAKYPKP